jgi:hypothetical protein
MNVESILGYILMLWRRLLVFQYETGGAQGILYALQNILNMAECSNRKIIATWRHGGTCCHFIVEISENDI